VRLDDLPRGFALAGRHVRERGALRVAVELEEVERHDTSGHAKGRALGAAFEV
jgi:hypothetical protein